MRLRAATRSDLDHILDIADAAFPYDPFWQYRYIHREKYPQEFRKDERLKLEGKFDGCDAGTNQILVVELSDPPNAPDGLKVIVYSIWYVEDAEPGIAPTVPNCDGRKYEARARGQRCNDVIAEADRELFYSRYGKQQRMLYQLATHPDHWRKGAGHMMVTWGIEQAKAKNVAVPVFASPMGKALYEQCGFVELAKVHNHVEGESESLDMSCMTWEPPERDGSTLAGADVSGIL